MPLSVELCSDSDIDEVFRIISEAFKDTQPAVNAIFPRHQLPDGRAIGTKRLLRMKQTDHTARFLKAIDTESGKIIGQAVWLLVNNPAVLEEPLEEDVWDGDDEKEFSQLLLTQLMAPRIEAAKSLDGMLFGKM